MTTAILTEEFIIRTHNRDDVALEMISVGYIRYLLRPFEGALLGLDNVDKIYNWIRNTFAGTIDDLIIHDVDKLKDDNLPISPRAVKETILRSLVKILTSNGMRNFKVIINESRILPWDIQAGIAYTPTLSPVFGIYEDENKLPVTFTVLGTKYTHMVSFELISGILAFCQSSGYYFQPEMFGHLLGNGTYHERFIDNFTTNYTVDIINDPDSYSFETPDFMQGIATGADWARVDHHLYWTDLRKYYEGENEDGDEDNEGTPITF